MWKIMLTRGIVRNNWIYDFFFLVFDLMIGLKANCHYDIESIVDSIVVYNYISKILKIIGYTVL